jgi:hypothetical protein
MTEPGTAVLITAGFGLFALVGLILVWQRPSLRRLERVVTFTLMGLVLVVVGTALIAHPEIERWDRGLAETVVALTVMACVPFCIVGFPVIQWWAARRYGREPAGAADFAEDRGGSAVRLPTNENRGPTPPVP